MTPEGRVKKAIKDAFKILESNGKKIWYHMPVQNGMGAPTLDFVICIDGKFWAIEAKAPGKHTTPRQEETIRAITAAGGHVMLFDRADSKWIATWLLMKL